MTVGSMRASGDGEGIGTERNETAAPQPYLVALDAARNLWHWNDNVQLRQCSHPLLLLNGLPNV